MAEVRVEIAGLGISLAGADTLRCAMALPGMGVFVAPEGDADLLVALDQPLGLPRCRLLHQFDIADGTIQARFGIDAEGTYYYAFGHQGLLRYDLRSPAASTSALCPTPRFCVSPCGQPWPWQGCLWGLCPCTRRWWYAMAAP